MFNPTSRYYQLKNATYTDARGRKIVYKVRRLLPRGATVAAQSAVRVRPADRLDLIAARSVGDPTLFWRLADANDAMDPFDLAEPGAALKTPRPGI
jgi:nucleoid-associated protein YgaU